jgi:hypothetical protein
MSGPRTLMVESPDCPGQQIFFDEFTVKRATVKARRQIAELRATDNFIEVAKDEGFIAVVRINFGDGIGIRDVTVDPLGLCSKLKPRSAAMDKP